MSNDIDRSGLPKVSLRCNERKGTDKAIFEFAHFEEEDAKFIGDVRDIVIAFFAPNGELLRDFLSLTGDLESTSIVNKKKDWATSSMLLMRLFSILMSWVSRFANSGAKAPAVFLRKVMPR